MTIEISVRLASDLENRFTLSEKTETSSTIVEIVILFPERNAYQLDESRVKKAIQALEDGDAIFNSYEYDNPLSAVRLELRIEQIEKLKAALDAEFQNVDILIDKVEKAGY